MAGSSSRLGPRVMAARSGRVNHDRLHPWLHRAAHTRSRAGISLLTCAYRRALGIIRPCNLLIRTAPVGPTRLLLSSNAAPALIELHSAWQSVPRPRCDPRWPSLQAHRVSPGVSQSVLVRSAASSGLQCRRRSSVMPCGITDGVGAAASRAQQPATAFLDARTR